MNGATLIEVARVTATIAHAGQVDKSGQPYIGHPQRVAARIDAEFEGDASRPQAIAAAWLHDVVEDTSVTLLDLTNLGFPQSVIEAVSLLTRPEEERFEGEYYQKMKRDANYGGGGIARRVKLADIADNTDPRRLAKLDDKTQLRLIKKYANALEKLA